MDFLDDFDTVATFFALAVLLWLAWHYKATLGKLIANATSAPPGVIKSATNAANGFPSGADPGTVPVAQYTQGLFESGRTLYNDVFGTSGPDPGSATVDQADVALAAYQPPSYSQLQSAYTQAPVSINNFLNTIQTNPGSLPIF
jgi:hypothetical protein